jgi:hypothetical protein
MKVYLGKHRSWIGPYQICDWLKYFGVSEDTCHNLGEKLSNTWVNKVCVWIDNKKKRKVKVVIHDYDTWNMDTTLAYIILPMLIQLKDKQHGAPFVDDSDVLEHLKSTSAPPKENEWDTDEFHFHRWEWVMDELIWTFTQIHADNDWENQYHTGEIDIDWKSCKEKYGDSKEEVFEMVKGPKDTHVFDKEGYEKHQARITNGLRLFGKYYQGLWD